MPHSINLRPLIVDVTTVNRLKTMLNKNQLLCNKLIKNAGNIIGNTEGGCQLQGGAWQPPLY